MGSSPCRYGRTVSVGPYSLATGIYKCREVSHDARTEFHVQCKNFKKKLTSRWKCDRGSPQYRISLAEAPFLMSGRSDIASSTVIVLRAAHESRVMFDMY